MSTIVYLGASLAPVPAGRGPGGPIGACAYATTLTAPGIVEIGGVPLVHASEIPGSRFAGSRVVIVEHPAGQALSLLRSIGVPAHRIAVWKDGAAYPAPRGASAEDGASSLAALENRHAGQRAFVLGNGPSLAMADLDRLADEITFASNKIYLAFDQSRWRPTYYTVCDHLVAQHNAERISRMASTALFPTTLRKFGCTASRGYWYEERFENTFIGELPETARGQADMYFSRDIRFGVHGGYTVIYHQLQLAYYMGVREVYLIGLDFSFTLPSTTTENRAFTSPVYRQALESQGEVNHFHPDYRKPGEPWSMPRLDLQHHAFRTARRIFEADGGVLINASRRTALTALPRQDLDAVLRHDHTSGAPAATADAG